MNTEAILTDPIAGLLGAWAEDLTVGSILLRILLTLIMGALIPTSVIPPDCVHLC